MKSKGDVIKAMDICQKVLENCSGCPYDDGNAGDCVSRLFNDVKTYLRGRPVKSVDTVGGSPVCGACGRVMLELQYWDEHRMPDYCPWCGTRIEWEGWSEIK